MEQGQDPDDYTFKLIEVRGRLHEAGKNISDGRFEDILVQGLTDDYEFVKMTSFHNPNFGIHDIINDEKPIHRPTLETSQHQHNFR